MATEQSIRCCSGCKAELVEGSNWATSAKKQSRYKCGHCVYLSHKKWRLGNPEREKAHARKNNRSPSTRYCQGKAATKKRGKIWTLTREEYLCLVSMTCHYCRHPLRETGTGLDQKTPGGGYTPENVVPCCHECNTAKHDHFSYEEMLVLGETIRKIKNGRLGLQVSSTSPDDRLRSG